MVRTACLTIFISICHDMFRQSLGGKHVFLQVNTMYQKCNNVATCNCGVAVKSGDTVFVTERCRRRGQNCQPGLPFCGGNRLNTVIYSRGIASNMRVFGRDAGTGFDVSKHFVNHVYYSRVDICVWDG